MGRTAHAAQAQLRRPHRHSARRLSAQGQRRARNACLQVLPLRQKVPRRIEGLPPEQACGELADLPAPARVGRLLPSGPAGHGRTARHRWPRPGGFLLWLRGRKGKGADGARTDSSLLQEKGPRPRALPEAFAGQPRHPSPGNPGPPEFPPLAGGVGDAVLPGRRHPGGRLPAHGPGDQIPASRRDAPISSRRRSAMSTSTWASPSPSRTLPRICDVIRTF